MSRPKKTVGPMTTQAAVSSEKQEEVKQEVAAILPLSLDYGREDLNTMGRKLNEVIEALNTRIV